MSYVLQNGGGKAKYVLFGVDWDVIASTHYIMFLPGVVGSLSYE